jgi:nucleoside-diphosphate-sugar epimerase
VADRQLLLITGHTGFLGRHLVEQAPALLPGWRLVGVSRTAPDAVSAIVGQIETVAADVADAQALATLVERLKPAGVIHLAAAPRDAAFDDAMRVNVAGTHHLLAALRESAPAARVVVCGSSAEIGLSRPDEMPLGEDCACRPVGAYGVSKLCQSVVARSAFDAFGQHVVRIRLFNMLGAGMPSSLLGGRCAEQLAERRRSGSKQPLLFGDLTAVRDYIDARDAARALLLGVTEGAAGALYHVGSGHAQSGEDVVTGLIEASGLGIDFEVDPSRVGGVDVPIQVADPQRAAAELGWRAQHSFEESLLATWLAAAAGSSGPPPAGLPA